MVAPPDLPPEPSAPILPMVVSSAVDVGLPIPEDAVSPTARSISTSSLDVPSSLEPSGAPVPPVNEAVISPISHAPGLKSSWVSVLAEKVVTDCSPPARVKVSKGVVRTSLPVDLLRDQAPLWSKYIAGHFIGDVSPHIGKVHATVNRLWTSQTKKTRIDAQFVSPKVVLFKIEDEVMRRRVLQRHFWHVADIPMIVQEWSPSNAGKSPDLSSIPLWVDFINVPDSLFSKKGLLFLGNLVGKSQKLHPSTERCTRFDVARVLVEVNLNVDPPSLIKLDGESEISIYVAYPWLPPRCSSCGRWGHKVTDCVLPDVAALVGSSSGKSSSPAPRPTAGPALNFEKNDSVLTPVSHTDSITPELVHASPEQANAPEQVNALPILVADPVQTHVSSELVSVPVQVLALPELTNIREQALASIASSDISVQVLGSEQVVLPVPVSVSPVADPLLSDVVPNASSPQPCVLPEQSWTLVSKTKCSPARTIMTRGKCVAAGELLPSRFQVLEKEPHIYDDIEDGEIQGSHIEDASSDSADSEALASQVSSQGEDLRINISAKTHATRQKDNIKVTRQNHKSKKSSSRKA